MLQSAVLGGSALIVGCLGGDDEDEEPEREAYSGMVAEAAADPILVGTVVVGSLFLPVSIYLWTLALEYSSNLNRRQAGLVTVVPVVTYVAFTILRVL